MTDNTLLRPGDRFPALMVALPGGAPGACPTTWPGTSAWSCSTGARGARTATPSCAPSQRSLDRLTRIGGLLVALSVDDEATTQELIAKQGRHRQLTATGHHQGTAQRPAGLWMWTASSASSTRSRR
jgi:hypothetical protein